MNARVAALGHQPRASTKAASTRACSSACAISTFNFFRNILSNTSTLPPSPSLRTTRKRASNTLAPTLFYDTRTTHTRAQQTTTSKVSRLTSRRRPLAQLARPLRTSLICDSQWDPLLNMVARHNAPRAAPRGPAARRAAARADKDGDVSMGVSIKGRGGISKSTAPTGPKRDLTARAGKAGILSSTAQREILRKAGAGDVSMKEPKATGARGGLVELKVTGWQKSKASGNSDGGISSLTQWLEKKASTKLGSKSRAVKIRKVRCRQCADHRIPLCESAATSGPPSLQVNFRTTTAIQSLGDCFRYG